MFDSENLFKNRLRVRLAGLMLVMCSFAHGQVHLVRDFNPFPEDGYSSASPKVVEAGGITYFVSYKHLYGAELWKTDGTEAGTVMVKDIYPGAEGSSPQELTNVNGILFFSANTREHGRELWKSNGTAEGTVMVKDLFSGTAYNSSNPTNLFNAGGTLYFSAYSFGQPMGLVKSDGTEEGTVTVSSTPAEPGEWAYANGVLYFAAGYDRELWKTDGTPEGTTRVKDINPGYGASHPTGLIAIDGIVYFRATNSSSPGNYELWKTDGTEDGTQMIKEINATGASYPRNLVNVNGRLYFTATNSAYGHEVWTSDGTDGGTQLIKDINPDAANGVPHIDNLFTIINNTLFFVASSSDGNGLWKSDGTTAGTQRVAALPNAHAGTEMEASNGSLYFRYSDGDTELWKSDGTQTGTKLFKNLTSDGSSSPRNLTDINGRLYFYAYSGLYGNELWKCDGTPASTNMIKDVATGSQGSHILTRLFSFGNAQYFLAADDEAGQEIHKSDGTSEGTTLLKDMTDLGNSWDARFIDIGESFIVTLLNNRSKYRIWKSDGTEAGTVALSPEFDAIDQVTYVNGIIYFVPNDGDELWKCDYATGATAMVKDMTTGTSRSISDLTNVNGILFFTAVDGDGYELWKCDDGTLAGTVMVKDINPSPGDGSDPHDLTAVGNMLFFAATDAHGDEELWKSDGTLGGTVRVRNINPDGYSAPRALVNLNGTLYFQGNYDVPGHGTELWKSDGTENGTVLVKTIGEVSVHWSLGNMTRVNNTLYFWADDGEHGLELWKTDGTEAGTKMVKDITPGLPGSGYNDLQVIGDKVFFIINGVLWKSEGDECNTIPVTDVTQISVSYIASAATNNKLLFIGSDAESGNELFYYDLSHVVPGECEQTITFGALDPRTYGDAAFEVAATSSSGLEVTLESSNPAVATVTGKTITILAAGETVITARQAGDENFKAAQHVTRTLTVNKKAQSITFAALPVKKIGDAAFDPGATTTSGLAVRYTSNNPSVATIDDNRITIVGAGIATITASQGGDGNHTAAASIEQSLIVNKRTQSITFAALSDVFSGDAPFNLTATASSALTVSYTSSNTAVATISNNVVTITGEGETTITASQAGNSEYAAAEAVTQKLVVKLITEAETTPDRIASVYPNPVTDRVVIETQVAAQGSAVQVTDLYGRVMNVPAVEANAFIHTLDVSLLPAGVYVLQVTKGAQVITTKRIIKK